MFHQIYEDKLPTYFGEDELNITLSKKEKKIYEHMALFTRFFHHTRYLNSISYTSFSAQSIFNHALEKVIFILNHAKYILKTIYLTWIN